MSNGPIRIWTGYTRSVTLGDSIGTTLVRICPTSAPLGSEEDKVVNNVWVFNSCLNMSKLWRKKEKQETPSCWGESHRKPTRRWLPLGVLSKHFEYGTGSVHGAMASQEIPRRCNISE